MPVVVIAIVAGVIALGSLLASIFTCYKSKTSSDRVDEDKSEISVHTTLEKKKGDNFVKHEQILKISNFNLNSKHDISTVFKTLENKTTQKGIEGATGILAAIANPSEAVDSVSSVFNNVTKLIPIKSDKNSANGDSKEENVKTVDHETLIKQKATFIKTDPKKNLVYITEITPTGEKVTKVMALDKFKESLKSKNPKKLNAQIDNKGNTQDKKNDDKGKNELDDILDKKTDSSLAVGNNHSQGDKSDVVIEMVDNNKDKQEDQQNNHKDNSDDMLVMPIGDSEENSEHLIN